MSVKGYLGLLVGVFVVAPAVVTVTQRASADGGRPAVLVPVLVTLAAVGLAVLLIRLVLRDIARPFHSAGANIGSNVDQLSTVVQRLAATTADRVIEAGDGEQALAACRRAAGRGPPRRGDATSGRPRRARPD
ncbi:MAG TPA: hypothetical protein VG499_16040 [Actinomycetota bacterium]|nr:hypothetical protein [Actinomycetota bacterium]